MEDKHDASSMASKAPGGGEDEEVVDLLATLKCSDLQPFHFDREAGRWIQGDRHLWKGEEGGEEGPVGKMMRDKRRLVFVTYNVWFGTRRETKEQLQPRFSALFRIVASKDPDVVCFQEMTTNIIALLMEQEWVRERYWITDTDEACTFLGYGVLMLSKLPYRRLLYTPRLPFPSFPVRCRPPRPARASVLYLLALLFNLYIIYQFAAKRKYNIFNPLKILPHFFDSRIPSDCLFRFGFIYLFISLHSLRQLTWTPTEIACRSCPHSLDGSCWWPSSESADRASRSPRRIWRCAFAFVECACAAT